MTDQKQIIEKVPVQSFKIAKFPGLDPVEIFLTDDGTGFGSLTVTCYRSAFTCWWGAMGGSIFDFLKRADKSYLHNCLMRSAHGISTKKSAKETDRYLEMIVEAIKLNIHHCEAIK